MRRFTPEFIEQVRLANDIVDTIGEDTFLKRSGSNYMGLCPFPSHKEKTPSFSVSPDAQLYHCFGCGESGNIFTYLQTKRGFHFPEAVMELARQAGIDLPINEKDTLNTEDQNYLKRKQLLELNALACMFYEKAMLTAGVRSNVNQFLKKRSLSEVTVKEFRLGYADSSWDGLVNFLKRKGQSLEEAVNLGLIKKKSGRFYDVFRNRLIFPIFSKNGREILGFGARSLDSSLPKYINSTDSVVFHKGKTFYGWHKSAADIRSATKAILVEGYTDYLSLYQNGVQNVVATLGTALTIYHAKWLARYVQQVILCFDADLAGKKAAERSLNILLFSGLIPKILQLPAKEDPDSFIRKMGKSALLKKIHSAKDLFLQKLLEELKNTSTNNIGDRFSLIYKMAPILASTKNKELKAYYIQRVIDLFGSDEKWARQTLNKEIQKNMAKIRIKDLASDNSTLETHILHNISSQKNKISIQSANKAELSLLILALDRFETYVIVRDAQIIDKISHPGIRYLFDQITSQLTTGSGHFNTILDIISSQVLEPHLLRKEHDPSLALLPVEKTAVYIRDCVEKIKKYRQRLRLKEITANMRVDADNSKKYLKKIIELTKNTDNGKHY